MEDLTRGRETNPLSSTTRKCYAFSKNEFILVALYTVYWSSDKVQLCHPKSFYFKLVKWTADFIKSYNELFFSLFLSCSVLSAAYLSRWLVENMSPKLNYTAFEFYTFQQCRERSFGLRKIGTRCSFENELSLCLSAS